MSKLVDALDAADRRLLRRGRPRFHSPMLATLTDDHLDDGGWCFELKFDGERALAIRDGDNVQLVSRNRKALDATYPELIEALQREALRRFVIDGEIVALGEHGVPSFARLQGRMQRTAGPDNQHREVPVVYYVFDLLNVDGYDTGALALSTRKVLLRRALTWREPLRYSEHQIGDGLAFLAHACERGYEGLIAKRPDRPYIESRSRDWLKLKCVRSQEFVIGGYTEPKGTRAGLGALLVGYYDHDRLIYAGKVGTGFDTATLTALAQRLQAIERRTSPFHDGPPDRATVHWVRPQLVREITFTEWTRDGLLRHPRYKGLRRDKAPRTVVRERSRHAA
jgi:bifunctional non-homologous end joining protein LigD